MQYVLSFLEGIITFISPCLLPMLPVYVSYFAAGSGKANALKNALGFVLGFAVIFILLGAFAGSIGRVLREYGTAVNIVTGLIVVVFGLNYLGVFHLNFMNRAGSFGMTGRELGFFSSILFGMVFSIGWTPCVSAYLGSALMLASQQGSVLRGTLMLLAFSLGLGLPFVVSALLLDRLKSAFDFIKKHYRVINVLSGGLLLLVGVLMMTGALGYFLSMLTF
jgi:cytochrome c-type biogenesis protein